jgi:hypothetical protein
MPLKLGWQSLPVWVSRQRPTWRLFHGVKINWFSPELLELSRFTQICLGILLLILLPVLLVLGIAILLVCMVGGALLAGLFGPCILINNNSFGSNCEFYCCIVTLLLPIVMVCCAIAVFFLILVQGVIVLVSIITSYASTSCYLICNGHQ